MSGVHNQRNLGSVKSPRSSRFGDANPGPSRRARNIVNYLRVYNDPQLFLALIWMLGGVLTRVALYGQTYGAVVALRARLLELVLPSPLRLTVELLRFET